MSRAIDVEHLGRDRVICAFEPYPGLIVDPGPASCLETLLEGLESDPYALLLTHIHLDHAGAAGVLARRFPELTVYVHERGAPHLVDPVQAARERRAPLRRPDGGAVGRGRPDRPRAHPGALGRRDGRGLPRGLHARPRLPPRLLPRRRHRRRPTWATWRACASRRTSTRWRPPRRRTSTWTRGSDSIDLIEAWQPTALCLTHFGRFEDVPEQLERIRESLSSRAAPRARAEPGGVRRVVGGRDPRAPWTPRPPRR